MLRKQRKILGGYFFLPHPVYSITDTLEVTNKTKEKYMFITNNDFISSTTRNILIHLYEVNKSFINNNIELIFNDNWSNK